MPDVSPDFPRAWVEFADPAEENQVIRADLTWLTSNWMCIFGNGCKGIYATSPDAGCCTLGAHFSDKADEKRTEKWAKKLTSDDWANKKIADKKGITAKDNAGDRKTRVVNGACIFQNPPDFPGGSGCALHHLAAREGVSFVETKPEVCWQVPMRRSYASYTRPDGVEISVVQLSEYERRSWGAGGEDFDWYCSANTEAHVSDKYVYQSNRDEIIALIGQAAYEILVVHCDSHVAANEALRKKNLPLLSIHPASKR